ncbi:hypothetical protein A6U87_24380 [Rhizobium sp. AC44/96]|nr:hypothetical protein A6U87_24380 [Rhizobium sp. AC44/96]
MTQTTDFITELIVAANQISAVTPFERRRLLERAVATTKALRELLLLSKKVVPISAGLQRDIEGMVCEAETAPEVLMAAVLLMAADEIRQLRILAHEDGS